MKGTREKQRPGLAAKARWGMPAVLLVVVLLSIVTILFTDCLTATRQAQRMESYGAWHAAVYGADEDMVKALSENATVEAVGQMTLLGNILDENGNEIGAMGCVDSALVEMGSIRLLDGRLPASDGEAAVEASMLTRLGYSYELGQTVRLTLLVKDGTGEWVEETRSFTLCGVVKNYTNLWKSETHRLASVLVAPSLEGSISPFTRDVFIRLYERYAACADDLSVLCDDRLLLNDYTYLMYSPQSAEALDTGLFQLVILLAGFAIIILLVNNELIRRQPDFVTLRILGATRGDVIGLFFRERIGLLLLAVLLGAVGGLGVSYGLFALLEQGNDALVFSVVPAHILQALGMDLGGLAAALIFCFVRLFQLPLRGRPEQQERRPAAKRRRPLDKNNLFACFRRADRPKRLLSLLLSAAASLLVLAAAYQTWDQYTVFRQYSEDYPEDYTYGMLLSYGRPQETASGDEVEKIRTAYGVEDVQTVSVSNYQEVAFPAGYDKAYAAAVHEKLGDYFADDDLFPDADVCGALTGISENLYSIYSPCAESPIPEDSLADNEVILYLPDYYVFSDGSATAADGYSAQPSGVTDVLSEQTVEVGDTLAFSADGQEYELVVAGIIRRLNDRVPVSLRIDRPYTILCSQKTYETMMGDGDYVYVLVYGDENAIAYQTDVELSKIQTPLYFSNNRVEREEKLQNVYTQLILALILSASGFMMVILARYGIQTVTNRYELARYSTLCCLGMTKKALRMELIKDALTESAAGCFLALAAALLWVFCRVRADYLTSIYTAATDSALFLQITQSFLTGCHWKFSGLMLFLTLLCNTALLLVHNRQLLSKI